MLSALTATVKASFFDNWWDLIKGMTVTTATKSTYQISEVVNPPVASTVLCFKQELEFGDENQEVKKLQEFLCQNSFYKECLNTGYFGGLTKKAVMNFQNQYFNEILKPVGLLKATGYVGQATLQKINKLIKCGEVSNNTPITIEFNNMITGSTVSSTTTSTSTTITTLNIPIVESPDTTIENIKRYSCSSGKCIQNPTGAFVTSNCNNMCNITPRYACNNLGVCQLTSGGPYTVSNCDNECIPAGKKLLEESFYNRAKTSGRCWCTEEKTGDFFRETLSEDKLFYPQLKITDPVSYKKYLSLNTVNFPSNPMKGCCDFGWIKICLDGTTPKRFGYELVDSFSKLNKYFKVTDTTAFGADFFEKNILVFVYSVFLEEQEMDCKAIITDFKVDRIVHNAPDLDEIYATNDTTPYNYRLPKYYKILIKTNRNMIADNNKVCALNCKPTIVYYFDAVVLSKEELKKPDGTYKKIDVDLEGAVRYCSVGN